MSRPWRGRFLRCRQEIKKECGDSAEIQPLGEVTIARTEAAPASVAETKQQLVEAMRARAIWAGLRTVDGSAPPAPRWVEERDAWYLVSGEFRAGNIRRPVVARRGTRTGCCLA